MNQKAEPRFDTNQVTRLTGATTRQLQWWKENGIIRPSMLGHTILYTEPDILTLRIVHNLRKARVSLQTIRRALKNFKHPPEFCFGSEAVWYVAFDGRQFLLSRSLQIHSPTGGDELLLPHLLPRLVKLAAPCTIIRVETSDQVRVFAKPSTFAP